MESSTPDLLKLFGPEKRLYREIPNEYCGPSCSICATHPWLIVNTNIGRIKIGWRKRVIVVDWTDSDVSKTAADIFPKEDVTKEWKLIHAWGYAKAGEYIARLLSEASTCPT